ncbi:MAG: hypothetical protein GY795_03035 [Desulfobacterales bacterium]|nr:hypothetical protein [Desulfobacterales bacterium]
MGHKTVNNKKKNDDQTTSILKWMKKIETSKLSVTDFFNKYKVPFSRSQYYIYSRKLKENGRFGLYDKRTEGGNRKVNAEIEAFISGCIAINPNVEYAWLIKELLERYNCKLSPSGITRLIRRIGSESRKRSRGRPEIYDERSEVREDYNSCGGFELITALAYHLKWPQETAKIIMNAIHSIKSSEMYQTCDDQRDKDGHDDLGRFTGQYNKREEIRQSRFDSISDKRKKKNWKSMNIFHDRIGTIESHDI